MSQRVEGHVRTQVRVVPRLLPPVRRQARVLHRRAVAHPPVVHPPEVARVPHRAAGLPRRSVEHHNNGRINAVLHRQRRNVQPQNEHVGQRQKVVPLAVCSNLLFRN